MTISKPILLFDTGSTDTQKQNNPNSREQITLDPGNLFLLFLSTILFIASGVLPFPLSVVAAVVSAPMYSVFSYKIGNRFSFLSPLVAFVISLVATGSITRSLTVVLAAAMSFCITSALMHSPLKAKTSAVIRCTIAFIVFFAAQILVFVISNDISSQGALANVVNAYFDTVKELVTTTYTSGFEQSFAGSEFSKLSGFEVPSAETLNLYIDAMIYQAKVTLPATLTLWMMVISYLACSLLRPFSKLFGARDMLEGKVYSVTVSGVCLVAYFVASLGMILSNGPSSLGFRNIVSVISPCLMLCGIKQIGEFLRTKIPASAIFIIKIASLFAALILGSLGTTALTVLGMYYTTHGPYANRPNN